MLRPYFMVRFAQKFYVRRTAVRRTISMILLIATLFAFQPAHAQSLIRMSSVEVQIWPEYDKPSVLVIYYINLSPDTRLPATLRLRIPAAAQSPHVVAVGATPETVTDAGVQYSLEPQGEWVAVVIEASGAAIQLEYYDPALTRTGKAREFQYHWPGDYAVNDFQIKLQQPFDASKVITNPVLGNVTSLTNGMTYHEGAFGALSTGKAFSLNVQYQKDSDALSISFVPVEASAPLNDNTTGRTSFKTYLWVLVAATALLLLAGGYYIYMRGGSKPQRARKQHAPAENSNAEPVYCHQCGARAHAADRFCRTCGTRLRVGAEK